MITSHLSLKLDDKQEILECFDVTERIHKLLDIIADERKILSIEKKIGQKIKTSMEKTQKEYYLREQLKVIQKELGDRDGRTGELEQLRTKIEQSDMPERITTVAMKELGRYEKVPQSSAESSVIRNYIEWLVALPWQTKTEDNIQMKKAEKVLNADRYGLEKVKEHFRILSCSKAY